VRRRVGSLRSHPTAGRRKYGKSGRIRLKLSTSMKIKIRARRFCIGTPVVVAGLVDCDGKGAGGQTGVEAKGMT
jgi:hypothetical protein